MILKKKSAATEIRSAKYEKANIHEEVKNYSHLNDQEKVKLLALLMKHEALFDRTLGNWRTSPVDIKVKPGTVPFCARPFPVPHVHIQTLKQEIERLVKLVATSYPC